MAEYHVNNNQQDTGEHEVHEKGCSWFPSNTTYLGTFSHCKEAVEKAKNIYSNVDGCKHYCPDCHTR